MLYSPRATYTNMVPSTDTSFAVPFAPAPSSPSLLMHFEGTDASQVFVDSSGFNHPFVLTGSPQIDTAQFKFGSASGLFSPATGDVITILDNGSMTFGLGDFTIDFWYRPATVSHQSLFGMTRDAEQNVTLYQSGINELAIFDDVLANNQIVSTAGIFSINIWYHIAWTRSGIDSRLFLNGVQVGSTYSASVNYTQQSVHPHISEGSFPIDGWVDELRVIKGYAAWTTPFTPPPAPYPSP